MSARIIVEDVTAGHDHAAGLRIRRHPAFDGRWVVEDEGGRVLFVARSEARARAFIEHHAEARATWCGCEARAREEVAP